MKGFHIFIIGMLLVAIIPAFGQSRLPIGSDAPDFTLPSANTEGSVTLSDYVDKKVVIVHFWKSR